VGELVEKKLRPVQTTAPAQPVKAITPVTKPAELPHLEKPATNSRGDNLLEKVDLRAASFPF
jgi:hypothetical protein